MTVMPFLKPKAVIMDLSPYFRNRPIYEKINFNCKLPVWRMGWHSKNSRRKEVYHTQFRGEISNIVFKDIQVVGGLLPFSVFHGFNKEKNVSGIKIENLSYMGKKLTTAESAKIRQQNTENLTIK